MLGAQSLSLPTLPVVTRSCLNAALKWTEDLRLVDLTATSPSRLALFHLTPDSHLYLPSSPPLPRTPTVFSHLSLVPLQSPTMQTVGEGLFD